MAPENQHLLRLHTLLNESLARLDEACALVEPARVKPEKDTVKLLAKAIGEILNARKFVYDADPKLRAQDRRVRD